MKNIKIGMKIGKFVVLDLVDNGESVKLQCTNCDNIKEKDLNSFLRIATRLNCVNCRGKKVKKKKDNPLERSYFRDNIEKYGAMSQDELDEQMNKTSERNLSTGIKNITFNHWGNKFYWQVGIQSSNFKGQVRLNDEPDSLEKALQIKRQMIASINATPKGEDWRMDAWKVKNYALEKNQ